MQINQAGKRKPRIVAFITSYFPSVGGAEICLRQVARRLSHLYDFLIITSRADRRNLPHETLAEGQLRRLGLGFRWDKWLLPLTAAGLRRELSDSADTGRPQALWAVDITQAALAAAAMRRLEPRLPLLLSIQYGEADDRLARGRMGLIGRSFSFMLTYADRVSAISTPLVAAARCYGWDQPVALIPNGVDLDVFHGKVGQGGFDPPVATSVSRLVPKNGLDCLLRSIALLAPHHPRIECRLIGSGQEETALRRLSNSLGIADRVHFLGDLPPEQVAEQLRRSTVFVRPSRSEGLGNAFAEAMACGLPVIGTPVGGTTDLIEDGVTGVMAEKDNPTDLAAKLGRLLADQRQANRLASAGQENVRRNYSLDTSASRYAELFDDLLGL